MSLKRLFDILLSSLLIMLFLPLFIALSIWISIDSRGGIFYKQERIGKNKIPFFILKFRTMYPDADKRGLLTVGDRDPRVTRAGYFLRKYKLDELPQLFNVWKGEMSLVGPRPEVKKYTDLYTPQQAVVLTVTPGITDFASIQYVDESELLARSDDPESLYIEEIMPQKLALNLQYIAAQSFKTDLYILLQTALKIIKRN
jgi:lipopolysaccharide/colanic/teichoic acid biosynthesis glycosyltransferase